MPNTWISPDNCITKHVIDAGEFGCKPVENSSCKIEITSIKCNVIPTPSEYLVEKVIDVRIGEADTQVDREIDKCLLMMERNELSDVDIKLGAQSECLQLSFCLKLISFESNDFIYEQRSDDKCKLMLRHKDVGVKLFNANRFVDASHRFSRGLKILLSIPIPVDEIVKVVEDLSIKNLNDYKINLYNNLASCNLKLKVYDSAVTLCDRVLEMDSDNKKALYKRGLAYEGLREFEKARVDLIRTLELDPANKTVHEKLQFVQANVKKQQANYDVIVKKMFGK